MASSFIEEFKDCKVKYDLFDIETGQTFNVLVDRSEVNSLDNDHNKRWRLLKKLKEGNVCAASSWLDVEVSQVVTDHGSVWEPCQTKAKKPGKAGVTCGDDNTRKFLNAALPHRVQLRQYRVSKDVFENTAKTLKLEGNLSYNHGSPNAW